MGKFITAVSVSVILLLGSTAVLAQDEGVQALRANAALGAVWGTLGFSVGVEKIMDVLEYEDFMIDGTWGVGADIGYARDKETYTWWTTSYSYVYTYIPAFIYASYHHSIDSEKLDPFVKLGLGYVHVGFKEVGNWSGITTFETDDSHIDLVSQIGARYQLTDKMAVVGTIGHPWIASVGVDIGL